MQRSTNDFYSRVDSTIASEQESIMIQSQLKVNVCSLAAESRIIRKQVDDLKRTRPMKGADPECQKLIQHRRGPLRNEARAAQLVYAFVRGTPYRRVEQSPNLLDWKWVDTLCRVRSKCRKLGLDYDEFQSWTDAVVPAG